MAFMLPFIYQRMALDITKECTSSISVEMFEGKLSFQKGSLNVLFFWVVFG
jgi:hypothetical protein